MAPIRTGAASSRRRDARARGSMPLEPPCGSARAGWSLQAGGGLGGRGQGCVWPARVGRGVPGVGLTGIDGGMLRAEREDSELGFVGRVTLVDSALIEELVDAGRVPIIAPAALDRASGEVLNVNGDAAAGAIAASVSARPLVFVTDVPGVRGKDGRVIAKLDADKVRALVDDGTIEGGMLPKVEACLIAAAAGCRAAIVATRGVDSVERLLAGEQVGTVFEAAA